MKKCKNVLRENFSNSNNSTLSFDCSSHIVTLAHWLLSHCLGPFLAQLVFFNSNSWRCGCGWCTHLKCGANMNRTIIAQISNMCEPHTRLCCANLKGAKRELTFGHSFILQNPKKERIKRSSNPNLISLSVLLLQAMGEVTLRHTLEALKPGKMCKKK